MKRFASLIMIVLVLVSCFSMLSVNAQMTDTNCIYFKVPDNDRVSWNNFSMVFCHIWREGNEGGDFYAWQGKEERCTDLKNGYWSYDLSGLEFDPDGVYCVIFSNENGKQTYNLTLTSQCLGDIAVCDGDTCVNPVDGAKTCDVARWLHSGDSVHPCAAIDSTGTLVDPDNIDGQDIDRTFGDLVGTSVELEEVESYTQSVEPTEATEKIMPKTDGFKLPLFLIIGGVFVVLVVLVGLFVAKSKKQ